MNFCEVTITDGKERCTQPPITQSANKLQSKLGMYRIAIFKIRPEPESTGYQMNYPAGTGTGYL